MQPFGIKLRGERRRLQLTASCLNKKYNLLVFTLSDILIILQISKASCFLLAVMKLKVNLKYVK